MKGVPATAGMAFLVATPELSLDALLISLPLLGGEMTVARVAAAGFVALAIGWLLGRFVPSRAAPAGAAAAASPGPGERLTRFRENFRDVVDSTAPWILVGLGLAAVVEPSHSAWADLLPSRGRPDRAVRPFWECRCTSAPPGPPPWWRSWFTKGSPPGAALAFLLTGPATNVTTFGILTQLHGRRIALAFGAGIACLAVLAGHAVNALGPALPGTPLHQGHASSTGLQGVSLAVLALIVAASLLRRGPRGFVGQLFAGGAGKTHPGGSGTSASPGGSDCCPDGNVPVREELAAAETGCCAHEGAGDAEPVAGGGKRLLCRETAGNAGLPAAEKGCFVRESAVPQAAVGDCGSRGISGQAEASAAEKDCCAREVVAPTPAAPGSGCCARKSSAASAEGQQEPAPVRD